MKFFEKRDRRGVACNPEQATGLLTGGVGTLFDKNIHLITLPSIPFRSRAFVK